MAKKKPVASKTEPDLSYISEPLRPLAVPVDDIDLDPANARKHGTENLSALRGSLRSFGQCKPIVVNKRTRIVEAGNGTLTCARAMGWSHIAVVFVEHDPSQAAAFAISDNRVSDLSTWDTDALDQILREIETGDEDLQAMLSKLAEDEELYSMSGADGEDTGDKAVEIDSCNAVLVECGSESEQRTIFEEMQKRGLKCRVLTV